MKKTNLIIAIAAILICCLGFTASAQHHNDAAKEQHKLKYHNVGAVFVGSSLIRPSGFNLPTVGLEYIREINHNLGVGLMAEIEIGSHIIQEDEINGSVSEVERKGAALLIPALFYRVYKGLIVSAGYGVEFEAKENLGLFKASLEYRFFMKNERYMILPTVSWDHTKLFDGLVYGVNFAYVF